MATQKLNFLETQKSKSAYIVIYGPVHTETYEIGEFLSIGRDPTNRICVNDPFTSTRHAVVEKRGDQFILRDLNSSNGTFLNGQNIMQVSLKNNDRITIGQSKLYFSFSPDKIDNSSYLLSKNTEWSEQLERLPSLGQSDLPILIEGPSGTGKEKLARLLHDFSDRCQHPFISVNCSALSENLVESELFGHIRGSFTGATGDRKGAFESARGGTLFLDEMGDLPMSLQPKLLRALENQEVKPVGSDKPQPIDVRVVAATHKSLASEVRDLKFREDLYYRVNVLSLQPPALIDRMEDFETLLYIFGKKSRVRFSHNAIKELKKHEWPGNIRELKNLVARASALYQQKEVDQEDIIHLIGKKAPVIKQQHSSSGYFIKDFEKDVIIERLIANQGNQRRTARELGMPKSTLNDRIKNYNLDLEAFKRG